MKLNKLRISNFQSFGNQVTEISLDDLTFLIGPNGSGKTAALQALCRMFAFDPSLRRILQSDFHVLQSEISAPDERNFWIEAEFGFPELANLEGDFSAIPQNFKHLRLESADGIPFVRFRLDAKMDSEGEISADLNYMSGVNPDGKLIQYAVPRADRNSIHVHYLPARRDPSDHIAYTANSLLGRVLRSINWQSEREEIKGFSEKINDSLVKNSAVTSLSKELSELWSSLHKGKFFSTPKITFANSEIEALLRHLSISFSPAHGEEIVDFSRLSDGQKSMLYLSLVLSMQGIGRSTLSGESQAFDIEKLKPAIFTLVAMEEPENSLSPHYLGRVVQALKKLGEQNDAQALIATHAPSMLRRIKPESIRYMRLNEQRETQISTIQMPEDKSGEAYKFVREAVQAFPELYFSRLVVLGEGDSEEIVLPRLFAAKGLAADETAISVVPLGGRHVNHFWRLLTALDIPFVTLLDLDLARYQGGWGRVKYVSDQLLKYKPETCKITQEHINGFPKWDSDNKLLNDQTGIGWLDFLETQDVFFSSPLDIDFAMLNHFPAAFCVKSEDKTTPIDGEIQAVLGKCFCDVSQYTEDQQKLFITYHKRFKLSSKPDAHLGALAKLSNEELLSNMPESLARLVDAVIAKLKVIPE